VFVSDSVHRALLRAAGAVFPCTAPFFLGVLFFLALSLFLGPSRFANAKPISCNFAVVDGAAIKFIVAGNELVFSRRILAGGDGIGSRP